MVSLKPCDKCTECYPDSSSSSSHVRCNSSSIGSFLRSFLRGTPRACKSTHRQAPHCLAIGRHMDVHGRSRYEYNLRSANSLLSQVPQRQHATRLQLLFCGNMWPARIFAARSSASFEKTSNGSSAKSSCRLEPAVGSQADASMFVS